MQKAISEGGRGNVSDGGKHSKDSSLTFRCKECGCETNHIIFTGSDTDSSSEDEVEEDEMSESESEDDHWYSRAQAAVTSARAARQAARVDYAVAVLKFCLFKNYPNVR